MVIAKCWVTFAGNNLFAAANCPLTAAFTVGF